MSQNYNDLNNFGPDKQTDRQRDTDKHQRGRSNNQTYFWVEVTMNDALVMEVRHPPSHVERYVEISVPWKLQGVLVDHQFLQRPPFDELQGNCK